MPKKAAFPNTANVTGSRIKMKQLSVTSDARNKSLRAFHFARVPAAATKGDVPGGGDGGKSARSGR